MIASSTIFQSERPQVIRGSTVLCCFPKCKNKSYKSLPIILFHSFSIFIAQDNQHYSESTSGRGKLVSIGPIIPLKTTGNLIKIHVQTLEAC